MPNSTITLNRNHSQSLLIEARQILTEVLIETSTAIPERVKLKETLHHLDRTLSEWDAITTELENLPNA